MSFFKQDLTKVAQGKWCHSAFQLVALVVIKVNININHVIGLGKGNWLVAVKTLSFKDREKAFGMALSSSFLALT